MRDPCRGQSREVIGETGGADPCAEADGLEGCIRVLSEVEVEVRHERLERYRPPLRGDGAHLRACTVVGHVRVEILGRPRRGLLRATDPDQWNRPVHRGGQERVLIDPALRRLLEGLDSLADTVAFASAQEALAAALDKLAMLTGDAKLLDEALVHCRAGIEDLRPDEAPALWRALKLRFGKLAVNLGVSQKDDNLLEEAVATYATALAVWKRSDDEARWLEAEYMISRARATLGRRRSDLSLLERAFNGLNRVSQATDRSRMPMRWAELQDQMGGVLAAMGERYSESVVIEEAIAAFAAALEEYRQERAPLLWAQTSANQAEAMLQLARRTKDKALAQQALAQLMAATQTTLQAANGGAVAADLQKRLGAAGAVAAKLIGG